MTGYRFHAGPPPGHWFNDPNGLVRSGDKWRLFVQHAADPPEFRQTGWARLSSDDLISWTFDGAVMPHAEHVSRYSGSVQSHGSMLSAWLTHHDHRVGAAPRQFQQGATSTDDGATWREQSGAALPSGMNVRDPFVWGTAGRRQALVAHPTDWNDTDGTSFLTLHRERDGRFAESGRIGPWSPEGVLWEVPLLLDFGDLQVLVLSLVDRRDNATHSCVRYWTGQLSHSGFTPLVTMPHDGLPLDLGPDFYAAIPAASGRMLVGWASNWADARSRQVFSGGHGGAITMPRAFALVDDLVVQGPLASFRRFAVVQDQVDTARLHLRWQGGEARIAIGSDRVMMSRNGIVTAHPRQAGSRDLWVFHDHDIVEVFAAGVPATFAVAGKLSIERR